MTASLTVEQRDEALNDWAAGSCTATGNGEVEAAYFSHTERLTLAVASCLLGRPVPVYRSLWERLDRGSEELFNRALDIADWKPDLV